MKKISYNNRNKRNIKTNTMIKTKNIGYYLSLFGDKGSICIGGPQFNKLEHCYIEHHPELVEELHEQSEDLNEHELMYKDFIASILMKQPVLVNAEEAKRRSEERRVGKERRGRWTTSHAEKLEM